MKAATHPHQARRLEALRSYDILDSTPDSDFDDIVQLASKICEVPISVINFIDAERQWFKAEVGLGVRETPLDTSICSHVILEHEYVEITDTLTDLRMADNPLCTASNGFRFYAGALLKTEEGLPLGTLCVLDYVPRSLNPTQIDTVTILARQVMKQLELRKAINIQQVLHREIHHRVSNSLATVAAMVRMQEHDDAAPGFNEALQSINSRIKTIALLHRELCETKMTDVINLQPFMERINILLQQIAPSHIKINITFEQILVSSRQAASIAIIANEFVSNSLKHGFPAGQNGMIEVRGSSDQAGNIRMICRDDGIGMPASANEKTTSGIGMAIIQASARQLAAECDYMETATGFQLAITFSLASTAELSTS